MKTRNEMIAAFLTANLPTAQTHAGLPHADDVLGGAILRMARPDGMEIVRNFKISENADLVFDIGFGPFDHHQQGGNGVRENGIPYASAGLLWQAFGGHILQNFGLTDFEASQVWQVVDDQLIAPIDAHDNGYSLSSPTHTIRPLNHVAVLQVFMPVGDSSPEAFNDCYYRGVDFFVQWLEKTIERAIFKVRAHEEVDIAVARSIVDRVVIFDKFIEGWGDRVAECHPDVLYAIYPSLRGGWVVQAAPNQPGVQGSRKLFPVHWRGVDKQFLPEVTKVDSAMFVHNSGFLANVGTLEDAIKLAEIARDW